VWIEAQEAGLEQITGTKYLVQGMEFTLSLPLSRNQQNPIAGKKTRIEVK
jgi:hypothetical protein